MRVIHKYVLRDGAFYRTAQHFRSPEDDHLWNFCARQLNVACVFGDAVGVKRAAWLYTSFDYADDKAQEFLAKLLRENNPGKYHTDTLPTGICLSATQNPAEIFEWRGTIWARMGSKDPSEDLPTPERIATEFAGTDFGTRDHKKLLREGLLKISCGYHTGHTLESIMVRMGLKVPYVQELTDRGKYALWAWSKEFEGVVEGVIRERRS